MDKYWNIVENVAKPHKDRLFQSFASPSLQQSAYLEQLLLSNKETVFGRKYGFENIGDYSSYKKQVPIHCYEDFQPYIDKIQQGEQAQLTSSAPVFGELTGGSSGGSKLIPYTENALEGFRAAIFPWLSQLIETRPNVTKGSIYFAISPVGRQKLQHKGAIQLGSPDDTYYFGRASDAMASLLAVPASVAEIRNIEEWKLTTAQLLAMSQDLSFISIWSPTFLTSVLEALYENKADIADAIKVGESVCGEKVAGFNYKKNRDLAHAINTHQLGEYERIWPLLDTISCWMDGSSKAYAETLKSYFPNVHFQPKGLLSTEAAISTPIAATEFPVLSLYSGFFEFMDDEGECYMAGEVDEGREYTVLVSNYSGLYRYNTGDRLY